MIICPRCRTENIEGSKFCYKCGNEFLNIEEGTTEVKSTCLSCGSMNPLSTTFCIFCGAKIKNEIKQEMQNELLSYWYCKYDGALMSETSSSHQFPVAKDLKISLEQLLQENKIKSDNFNFVNELVKKIFEHDPEKNFAVLTRVRCPICLRDSYASVYTQPTRDK